MDTLSTLFPNGYAHYLAGGALIGAGIGLLFVTTGLIGGISTFFTAVWSFVANARFFQQPRFTATREWRLVYAAGLFVGGLVWLAASGDKAFVTALPWWQLALGGFVAGFGARMSNGCTSGHGVCGISSLQLPSMLATATFVATAMITAWVVRALGGA